MFSLPQYLIPCFLLVSLYRPLLGATPPAPQHWKTPQSGKASATLTDDWWRIFQDTKLTSLMAEATVSFPGLQASLSRLEQARAAVIIERSNLFPRVDAVGGASRAGYSQTTAFAQPSGNSFDAGVTLSYELDLWGRLRGRVRASRAEAGSAAADTQAAQLMLNSEVARLYFALRTLDEERQVLRETVKLREEALVFAKARVEAGATNDLDRVRAEAELAGAQAELEALAGPRSELENALALALGRVASGFRVSESKLPAKLPNVPKVMPSELVQRRPDVASSMRLVEAAQARIGVTRAAYFPRVTLGAGFGVNTAETDEFLNSDSKEWNVGLRFSVPLIVGGQRKAAIQAAESAMREAGSNFEEKLLTAFREVETLLATLNAQRTQAAAQERLQVASDAAAKLARQRYAEGITTYLEVIEAERTALFARRSLVQLRGQQFTATVQLIKALGGGWTHIE